MKLDKDLALKAIVERAWPNGLLTELAKHALNDTLEEKHFDKKFLDKEINNG